MDPDRTVLITGASGQVGRAMRSLRPNATYMSHSDLDVTDPAAVAVACDKKRAVVHLAALTDVDRCEREPDLAFAVNTDGCRNVVAAAGNANARVIFMSTDYVFDGTKKGEYVEEDTPAPVNVYGSSKLKAEHLVLQEPDNVVVRSSTIFGQGKNFVRTILRVAKEVPELSVVDDQVSKPTSASGLAEALWHLVDHPGAASSLHVAGEGDPCSRAELAASVLDAAGIDARVVPVDTPSFIAAAGRPQAPRPANSVLAVDRARSLGIPLVPWVTSLRDYVRSLA